MELGSWATNMNWRKQWSEYEEQLVSLDLGTVTIKLLHGQLGDTGG